MPINSEPESSSISIPSLLTKRYGTDLIYFTEHRKLPSCLVSRERLVDLCEIMGSSVKQKGNEKATNPTLDQCWMN